MNNHPTIADLHNEHRLWESELQFFSDEVDRYEARLQALLHRIETIEGATQVEQFHLRFREHETLIQQLKTKLRKSEHKLAVFVKELNGLGLNTIRMDTHSSLRDEMRNFRHLYADLKCAFRIFEAESV